MTGVPELKQCYEAATAARLRLERVAVGVEQLAVEIATVRGSLKLGRYIQDRLRQLLCIHPEDSLRYGSAEIWCTICFNRIDPSDLEARSRELMAHVITWCKCDTTGCPVHQGVNGELPPAGMIVWPIPESMRSPQLRPVENLVEIDDGML